MSLLNDDSVPAPPFQPVPGENSVLVDQRLLIVEDEFLIALDMQRALEAAGAGEVVMARSLDEVNVLGDAIAGFDLIILPPPDAGLHQAVSRRIASAGLAIVVCSGFHRSIAEGPLAGAEFLDKPFADDELIAACERALARRARAS